MCFLVSQAFQLGSGHATSFSDSPACRWHIVRRLSHHNSASWRTFVLNPVTHRYMCGHLRARSFSVHRHSPATYHLLPRADEASANSGLSQSLFQAIDWMKN
nr:uncharacterized protein LOC105483976 isoform X3 [Macaca nemestrina]